MEASSYWSFHVYKKNGKHSNRRKGKQESVPDITAYELRRNHVINRELLSLEYRAVSPHSEI